MTREEAKTILRETSVTPYIHPDVVGKYFDAMSMAIEALEQQPKTGHWIEKEDGNLDTYYDCSACGESWTTIEGTPWQNGMNYCPHCGAKMGKEFAWDKFPDTIC